MTEDEVLTKEDVLRFLHNIDEKLETPIELIAVGGTALVLINLKPKTKDVDFLLFSKSDKIIFDSLAKECDPEIKVDTWFGYMVFSTALPIDWFNLCGILDFSFKKIALYHSIWYLKL